MKNIKTAAEEEFQKLPLKEKEKLVSVVQTWNKAFEEYGTLADQLLKAKSILVLFLNANDNDDMLKAQREAWDFLGIVNPNERFEVTEKGKEYLSSH